MAFEQEGFCVVRGPDVLWGGDIRNFHPPKLRFDGVIGGPPCQAFSRLSHMVKQNGYQPKFGNLIPEFERVVSEAGPRWFIMENVPDAPRPEVNGFETFPFFLNNRWCEDENGEPARQNRLRAWTFGHRGNRRVLMINTVCLENMEFEYAATGGSAREVPVAIGGSGKRKFRDGKGRMPWNAKSKSAVDELIRKQHAPANIFEHSPFTVQAKCKMLGNGVPLPMGRAIAKAVKEATENPLNTERN